MLGHALVEDRADALDPVPVGILPSDTLPPRTSPRSSTTGTWPASARYLAHDKPARPPPTTTTRFGSAASFDASFADSAFASW